MTGKTIKLEIGTIVYIYKQAETISLDIKSMINEKLLV